jgi:hypothetical protein
VSRSWNGDEGRQGVRWRRPGAGRGDVLALPENIQIVSFAGMRVASQGTGRQASHNLAVLLPAPAWPVCLSACVRMRLGVHASVCAHVHARACICPCCEG